MVANCQVAGCTSCGRGDFRRSAAVVYGVCLGKLPCFVAKKGDFNCRQSHYYREANQLLRMCDWKDIISASSTSKISKLRSKSEYKCGKYKYVA